jgi:peptide deformylase
VKAYIYSGASKLAHRNLIYYGSKTLRKPAEEVKNTGKEIKELIDEMFKIMHAEKGIGLAAPQVDVSKKVITIDIRHSKGPMFAIINPVITGESVEKISYEEGCLSVPGIMREVTRPAAITVDALNPEGEEIQMEADGLLARVLQHEIDHLNGVLFIDYLEDFVRRELTAELKNIKKMNKKS